jgi:hypothetical protein
MNEYQLKLYGPPMRPYTVRGVVGAATICAADQVEAVKLAIYDYADPIADSNNAVLFDGSIPIWQKGPWDA